MARHATLTTSRKWPPGPGGSWGTPVAAEEGASHGSRWAMLTQTRAVRLLLPFAQSLMPPAGAQKWHMCLLKSQREVPVSASLGSPPSGTLCPSSVRPSAPPSPVPALPTACKSHSQEPQDYLDELKLAVAWDHVDIAKSEIFNGDVEWKSCDLEEVMVDALVSNKPEFVRLFVDNGADVADFLTYGRLQQLYRSVSPKSLLFDLLQRKQEEARLTLAGLGAQQAREPPTGPPAFSLHEVSRVLKDFLQDACRGFYQDGRPGGRRKAEKGPAKQPTGQKWLLDLNQKSENPWRDLFLWAVLQNRHEMATYFWAMGQEGVAAALAACKILKEMSHLETEAEAARAVREAKYEQLALDLFSECYSNSEDLAFALLVRRNRCWSKTTCLHLATEADAKAFFAHDGVQAFLTRIWWGDMAAGTPILRLLGAFFCPALVYTNLITFSEEASLRTGLEDLQELDSLDMEKSLLHSRVEEMVQAPRAQGDRGPRAVFLLTRWRKFWGAPVTVFLGNVVMYFAFLFLFTYVLLLDFRPPPQGPSGPEVTLYFWVFTLVLEEIRQGFFTDEDTHLLKRFTLYVGDNWNKCDMVAIFLFIVGVTCRMLPLAFEAGRTVLAMDFMVFTLRLIHIFAIHKQLGPKIIVVERMMKDVFFFLFFLSVWLVAYGVTTQALLHPHDGRLEWIFRRVLYRPYLQIFGQIPLDEIDGSLPEAALVASPGLVPTVVPMAPLPSRGPCELLHPPTAAGGLTILPQPLRQLAGHPPAGHLPVGHQRAAHEPAYRHVQLHVPGGAGQRRHVLEVPALQPDCGVPRAPRPGPTLHPAQPPEPGTPQGLQEGGRAQAGAPGERPARPPGPEGRHLGDSAEGELPEQDGEAEEGQRGGGAAENGQQLPACSCRRVDFVAKYLGGLREQEKRIKHLESQINYCSVLVSSVADMLAQGGSPWSKPVWGAWDEGSRHCGGGSQLVASDHRGGLHGQEPPGAGQPSSDT
ncbi:transient receptor potential cation channel subfamily M member 5 isoform X2 [Trachypithecus francoisi]|uniref:transient receptor potential cation channel subfamily M member 5 isoform X2 n=1 Tax=Trachypithecus francoisi TaxID=54180 RepID=UPI00141B4533|nr:transient receptor potential cation channel subfamily M member 5 isoform X2 [Trachypithecus francoisi]